MKDKILNEKLNKLLESKIVDTIIGETKSGKPVYLNKFGDDIIYSDFKKRDHKDAVELHHIMMGKIAEKNKLPNPAKDKNWVKQYNIGCSHRQAGNFTDESNLRDDRGLTGRGNSFKR
ncbi:MAG: hypothetical protein ABIP51_15020 [Bacteroidia bacterium]